MYTHARAHTHAAVSLLNAPSLLSIMVCGVCVYVPVCKVWNDDSGLLWGGGRRQSKGVKVKGDFSVVDTGGCLIAAISHPLPFFHTNNSNLVQVSKGSAVLGEGRSRHG